MRTEEKFGGEIPENVYYIDSKNYQDLDKEKKGRLFDLFTTANITETRIAVKMQNEELVSALQQFCRTAEIREDGKIRIVLNNGMEFVAERGGLIGAVFSYPKILKKKQRLKNGKK